MKYYKYIYILYNDGKNFYYNLGEEICEDLYSHNYKTWDIPIYSLEPTLNKLYLNETILKNPLYRLIND